MSIGDTSIFTTVDAALWASLEDTTVSQGSRLDQWRREQSQTGTHRGTNFKDGEIPPVDDWRKVDFPALLVNSGGLLEPDDPQPDGYETFLYPVQIIGALAASRQTYSNMQKIRRFAHLVLQLLVLKQRTCFGLSATVVDEARFTGLEFLSYTEAEDTAVPIFSLGLELRVRISISD